MILKSISACKKWLKIFNGILRKSFKKIRLSKSRNSKELDQLFQKKEQCKQKMVEAESGDNLKAFLTLDGEYTEILEEIAIHCSQQNKEKVKHYLGTENDELEPHNQLKTWKLKKKLVPKDSEDPPSAKMNQEGELLTDKTELEKLYLQTYIDRLKPNPVPKDLKDIFEIKNLLFDLRMRRK